MSSRRRTITAGANQLGDLTFDDWYETPVFDMEPDERLEHLATSRRAPLRLVGSAMLRLAPARSGRPADPDAAAPGSDTTASSPAPAADAAVTEEPRPARPPRSQRRPARSERRPGPEGRTRSEAPARPEAEPPSPPRARSARSARPTRSDAPVPATAPAGPEADAWSEFASRSDSPARPTSTPGSWRQRAGQLLDRWAEVEAASQERLEELVLPKRWRS